MEQPSTTMTFRFSRPTSVPSASLPLLYHADPEETDVYCSLSHWFLQGQGPYAGRLKKIETEIDEIQKRVNEKIGIKESDTGLAPPNLWDIPSDKVRLLHRRQSVRGGGAMKEWRLT